MPTLFPGSAFLHFASNAKSTRISQPEVPMRYFPKPSRPPSFQGRVRSMLATFAGRTIAKRQVLGARLITRRHRMFR